MAGLYPVDLDYANALLVEWEHKLGPCERPFGSEAFVLELDGRPISVSISASTVSDTVAGKDRAGLRVEWERGEVVELARLASVNRWVNRIMLRLWRETCGPRWAYWPVKAAISYSKNALHTGDLYRFDGWERIKTDAGSSGGGTYTRKRYADDVVLGSKSLWMWRYTA